MHDEFSAIFRTYYSSFSELIEIGVKQNDSHPAGVQIFIFYWIKLFGLSEASLKFPFILAGTSSVYVVYLIGKDWFGKSTALFSALILAIVQFAIFHSQLARPYSPALFFVLLSTYFWTKLVFSKQTNYWTVVAYILITSIASYIHAFSLFFIFIQGLSGLFYLRGRKLWLYIISNLIVLLLYIPHFQVFLAQITRGDIGGWLGKPEVYFLMDFTKYVFHYSTIFIIVFFTIVVGLPFLSLNKKEGANKFRVLSVIWFLVSYLTAHIYSVYRTPIIQYSTLLFVFPYLLLFLFSFIGVISYRIKYIVVVLLSVVGLYTLVFEREHYKIMYTQGFDGISTEISNDIVSLSNKNKAIILHAPEHRMFDYYFDKYGLDKDYYKLYNDNSVGDIATFLDQNNVETLIYGWADYSKLEFLQFFRHRFKYIVREKQFFNAEYYIFSNFPLGNKTLANGETAIASISNKSGYLFSSEKPGYSKSIEIGLDTLALSKFDVINIKANIEYSESEVDALLVFEIKDKDGNSESWSASIFKDYYLNEDSRSFDVFHSKRLLSIYPYSEGAILKTYIWKRDNSLLKINKLEIYLSKLNPIEVGLYDDLN